MIRTMGFLAYPSILDTLDEGDNDLTFSLIQEHCARVLCSDAPAAQTARDAWMDMYALDRDQRDHAIEGSQGGQFGPQD
jgi:hypothetical protein